MNDGINQFKNYLKNKLDFHITGIKWSSIGLSILIVLLLTGAIIYRFVVQRNKRKYLEDYDVENEDECLDAEQYRKEWSLFFLFRFSFILSQYCYYAQGFSHFNQKFPFFFQSILVDAFSKEKSYSGCSPMPLHHQWPKIE